MVGANAIDNIWTGAKKVWYGTPQESLAQQGAGAVASGLGASQGTVDATKEAVGVGQGLIGGGPGGAADEASTAGREARAIDHAAEDGNAARRTGNESSEASEATESGEGGVRVAKKRFKNPCKHLAKGDLNGPGPYRGGSKDGTTGLDSNFESNHVPAWNGGASDTGLSYGASPSGAIDEIDHRDGVSSTGSSASAEQWRTQNARQSFERQLP